MEALKAAKFKPMRMSLASQKLCRTFSDPFLKAALQRYQKPTIFNSDQGAQLTANAFTQTLKQANVQISMDGRGRCYDNILIERLWRSIKYELIYLKAFDDGHHLSQEVSTWFHFYNRQRFHQSLNSRTPDEIYFEAYSKLGVMCNSC